MTTGTGDALSERLRTLRSKAGASPIPSAPPSGPSMLQPQVAGARTPSRPSPAYRIPSHMHPLDHAADLAPDAFGLVDDAALDELLGGLAFDMDDPESEHMARAVAHELAQARDEADLARGATDDQPPDGRLNSGDAVHGPPLGADQSQAKPAADLALPTVPSALVDPVFDDASDSKILDFEADIAARMAALKGLGGGVPAQTDAFGLPVAPTFQPADRPAAGTTRRAGARVGYTDEDQKTWCIVCLEDATIRCVGCDDDVYCGRCWREMHVGPRAGYDERGHHWVKFHR